jgi:hypothetical protein
MNPSLEEIKKDFAKWHGTQWRDKDGVEFELIGYTETLLVLREEGIFMRYLEELTQVREPREWYRNEYDWGLGDCYDSREDANLASDPDRIRVIKVREVIE